MDGDHFPELKRIESTIFLAFSDLKHKANRVRLDVHYFLVGRSVWGFLLSHKTFDGKLDFSVAKNKIYIFGHECFLDPTKEMYIQAVCSWPECINHQFIWEEK